MDQKHRGALNEHKAVCWLMEQGYEVFLNVSPFGPADLVAWRPEEREVLFVDVKTVQRYITRDGTVVYPQGREEVVRAAMAVGVKYLFYVKDEDRFLWREEPVEHTEKPRGEVPDD